MTLRWRDGQVPLNVLGTRPNEGEREREQGEEKIFVGLKSVEIIERILFGQAWRERCLLDGQGEMEHRLDDGKKIRDQIVKRGSSGCKANDRSTRERENDPILGHRCSIERNADIHSLLV